MKKRMCTYIVLCGVLSSSLVVFGMEQQKVQQLTKTNSGNSSPRSESSLREKAHNILEDIKAVENAFYTTTNPLVEAISENAELGVEFATVVGANKDKANYIAENKVVAIAALVDKTQDTLHALVQDLGKSHDSLSKSHDDAK